MRYIYMFVECIVCSADIWDMCEMSMSILTDSEFLKWPFSFPKQIHFVGLDCQVVRFSQNPKEPDIVTELFPYDTAESHRIPTCLHSTW